MNEVNYIFWMIIIGVAAPIYLTGALVVIEDEDVRKKFILWGAAIGLISFAILFYLQMNVEFIYGKELLDYWHALNADK